MAFGRAESYIEHVTMGQRMTERCVLLTAADAIGPETVEECDVQRKHTGRCNRGWRCKWKRGVFGVTDTRETGGRRKTQTNAGTKKGKVREEDRRRSCGGG